MVKTRVLDIWVVFAVLVVLICRYAHRTVSGDSIGDVLLLASQKFNSCSPLFSRPRQFPHSDEIDNPASNSHHTKRVQKKVVCHCRGGYGLRSPRWEQKRVERCSEWNRSSTPLMTWKKPLAKMDDHASKWLYALSGRGLPNTSSMSVDQWTESFDVSESWRNEVLLNELEYRILGSRGRHRVTEPRVSIFGAVGIDPTYGRRVE